MKTKIGWASGAVIVFAVPILILTYTAQDKKVPDSIFALVVVSLALVLLWAIPTWLAIHVVLPLWGRARSYKYRWPMVSKNKPDPNRWLLDRAEEQRDNPRSHLVFTDRRVMGFTRDAKRPILTIYIYYKNLGVYDLLVSQPEGFPTYNMEQLPEPVRSRAGRGPNNVPVNEGGVFHFDIYIPPDFLEAVRKEVDSITGEIRNFGFSDVGAKVQVKGDSEREFIWSLDEARMIIWPNR